MGIYVLVFSVLWKATQIPHYALYLLVGLVVWLFFSTSLTMASRSLVDGAPLVKKVRFPRQLVPLSVVATQLVTFAAMLAVLIVVDVIVHPGDARNVPARDPARRSSSSRSSAALSLAVACANVVFRDVEHLVTRGAPAVVLPDADPLQPRPAARAASSSTTGW